MNLAKLKYKIQRKLYGYYYNRIHKEPFLKYCSHYTSYRHSLKHNGDGSCVNYIAARPNPGAGIGHQMANWIAGYHLAKVLGLKFANIPFSRYHHPWVPTLGMTFWDLERMKQVIGIYCKMATRKYCCLNLMRWMKSNLM